MAEHAGGWREARVTAIGQVASNVMGIRFAVEGWPGHRPGQHVDVRLTAPDGYMAERSYSIANEPDGTGEVELGVELLENGEVSPYLWKLKPGDSIELRGPIGGHFIWDISMPDPLVLIAGGSGMVPLMAMIREHARRERGNGREVVFLGSFRSIDRLLYADELKSIAAGDRGVRQAVTLTDSIPQGWSGYARRIDRDMLEAELGGLRGRMPDIYVCGPTRFVEAAAKILVDMGFNSHSIRTERFG